MNSGHTRATAFVIRCHGEDNQPRCFSTWAAIALAGIGQLPATLADRSIEIKLKRKTISEPAQRLDGCARSALGEVARRVRWALDNRATVQGAEQALTPYKPQDARVIRATIDNLACEMPHLTWRQGRRFLASEAYMSMAEFDRRVRCAQHGHSRALAHAPLPEHRFCQDCVPNVAKRAKPGTGA